MSQTSSNGQQLPADLLVDLPAGAREALSHPYRRQILRDLHGEKVSLTPAELTETGPAPRSLSYAAYHLRVLVGSGLAATAEAEPAGGTVANRYSSLVEDGSPVLTVLRHTDQSDQRHFALTAS